MVRNRLRVNGLRARRPYVGLPLTLARRQRRLAWLQAHSPRIFPMRQWRRVFFTDESRFTLYRSDGRRRVYRRRRGERYTDACVAERDRFGGGSVCVWGGISYGFKSPLIVIDGNLTGVRYRAEILRPVAVPCVQARNRIFQQDNSRPHVARAEDVYTMERSTSRDRLGLYHASTTVHVRMALPASTSAQKCKCPHYDNLPQGCYMVQEQNSCCSKPQCNFQTTGDGAHGQMQTGDGSVVVQQGGGVGNLQTVACQDTLSNCGDYDTSTCSNPEYATWAKDNCAKTCNLCDGTGTGTGTGMSGGATGTGTGTYNPNTGTGSGTYNPNPGTGTGTYNPNTGTGTGTYNPNTGTGTGTYNPNTGTGTGTYNPNTGTGTGTYNPNTGTGTGTYNPNTGTGTGTYNPNTGTGTGTYNPNTGTGTGTYNPNTGTGSTGTGTGTYPSGSGGTGTYPSGSSGTGTYPSGSGGTGTYPSGSSGTGTYPSGSGGTGTYPAGSSGTGPYPGGSSGTGTYPGGSSGTGTYPGGSSGTGTYPSGSSGTGTYSGGSSGTGPYLGGSSGTGTYPGGSSGTGTYPGGPSGTGTYTGGSSGSGSYPGGSSGSGTGTGGSIISSGSGRYLGSCGDRINNCAAYGQSVCSDPTYQGWVKDNCAQTCNKCSSGTMTMGTNTGSGYYGPGGTGMGSSSTGTGSSGVVTGHSNGCAYKGQVYQQNQSWKDGCDYRCTCTDGTQGRYTCKQLCVQWDHLPNVCQMMPPPAGKCCRTPNCPSYVQLHYPDNYVPE
ncbi:putative per-hexamer repeat protein 5 [Ylistrum balloti]|uniref:putative per-hexamer repeat protein 5 n=1 Tax=Ylistrum balloti TaxID=509963 RepID=UPI002905D0F7|nr:putative per-hexamer repeat protein 5 [Ylistrum balloti]